MRVLFLFLDGVGIGNDDPDNNPFLRATLPVLKGALGRIPTLADPFATGPGGRAFPVDACLGVEGLPQSGTGQVALLTGRNAPDLFGRHFGPWVPVRLRPLLERENILVRARGGQRRVAFANAYPAGYSNARPTRRIAGVVAAAMSADRLERDHVALGVGEAVASEILNDGWIERLGRTELPRVSAEEAGVNLARIAGTVDLTMFAHYLTDSAGHERKMDPAVAALERVDRFLGGLLSAAGPGLVTFAFSDHGNIEDVGAGHTRNPSLGLVLGPQPLGSVDLPERLTDVRGCVLRTLGVARGDPAM